MRVIANKALRDFWRVHSDAEDPLRAWYREVEKEDWTKPADVKARYATASVLANNRVVFNVKGNAYRIVVAVNYPYRVVYIRFVGTHSAYDKIDAETI